MYKKLLVGLLIATMSLSVVACGAENNNGASNQQTNAGDINIEDNSQESDAQANTNEPAESEDSNDSQSAGTLGQSIYKEFKEIVKDEALASSDIADKILESNIIEFAGATMPVQEGLLNGFGNAEITGFSEGTMFAPMIGSIPFIGYVFILEDGADVEAFKTVLTENADPRWNVCTEADETVVENQGNVVFFLMCPTSFEE